MGAFSSGTHLTKDCCALPKLRLLNSQYRHEEDRNSQFLK